MGCRIGTKLAAHFMSTSEREVEEYLIWAVAVRGGFSKKVRFIGVRGSPDRAVFLPNGVLWLIELKAPKGRLSEHQKLFAEDMRRLKQPYACFWTVEQIDAWAQNFKVLVL